MAGHPRRFDPEGHVLTPYPPLARGPDDEDRMSAYEVGNQAAWKRTNGRVGMPIPLLPRGVFWSRGWRGCPQCGGNVTTHHADQPYTVREGGVVRAGFSCTGNPGVWEDSV